MSVTCAQSNLIRNTGVELEMDLGVSVMSAQPASIVWAAVRATDAPASIVWAAVQSDHVMTRTLIKVCA